MAWNPSPEVAVARDFGKKFGYDKVYIIGVDEQSGKFEIVSYGETKDKCNKASKLADKIYGQILTGNVKI